MSLLTWKFFCGETREEGGGDEETRRPGAFAKSSLLLLLAAAALSVRRIVMSGSHVIPRLFGSVFFAGKFTRFAAAAAALTAARHFPPRRARSMTQDATNFGAAPRRPLTR